MEQFWDELEKQREFWRQFGRLMAHVLPFDGGRHMFRHVFYAWYDTGEQYRLAGRSPADLVTAIEAVWGEPPQS